MDKREERIESLLKKLNEEQKKFKIEQKRLDEKQIVFDEKLRLQNKKNKRTIIIILIISLVFSGITSVASYTLGASSVEYTSKDANWDVSNTQQAIDDLYNSLGSSLVGSVYSYMGTSVPFGYLACDGSVYNIEDYPRLANHINRNFGSYNYFGGDGEATFAVPDLRGEFLRGTGTNSRTNQGSGATVGTHQDATRHVTITKDTNFSAPGRDGQYLGPANQDSQWESLYGNRYASGASYNSGSNWNGYFTSRPTNTSVLYIIKY